MKNLFILLLNLGIISHVFAAQDMHDFQYENGIVVYGQQQINFQKELDLLQTLIEKIFDSRFKLAEKSINNTKKSGQNYIPWEITDFCAIVDSVGQNSLFQRSELIHLSEILQLKKIVKEDNESQYKYYKVLTNSLRATVASFYSAIDSYEFSIRDIQNKSATIYASFVQDIKDAKTLENIETVIVSLKHTNSILIDFGRYLGISKELDKIAETLHGNGS